MSDKLSELPSELRRCTTALALEVPGEVWDHYTDALVEHWPSADREALAAYAHEAWSGWMKYLFSKTERLNGRAVVEGGYVRDGAVIPLGSVERWKRQMNTPYADLPESEKESDRAEADKMLAIVEAS